MRDRARRPRHPAAASGSGGSGWQRRLRCIAVAIPIGVVAGGAAASASAAPVSVATAYRCDTGGQTLYSDQPCAVGRATAIIAGVPPPDASERAAAVARLRADRATLAAIEADRRRDERLAATQSVRTRNDRQRHALRCSTLALRVRRAFEDVQQAGPRDQPKARTKAVRADEDRVQECGGR